MLNNQEQELYSRQIKLIAEDGQIKLRNSKVAIVGLGALGTVVADLLVRAGIGKLLFVDRDTIEVSNLQRQSLFNQNDIGKLKAQCAKEKLTQVNPHVEIEVKNMHLSGKEISTLDNYDLIIDCTDNLNTKFLLNDFAKKKNIPFIYAGAIRNEGAVFVVNGGPCLGCFLPENAQGETCSEAGVLNITTHIIGSYQANLALQILLGKEIEKELISFDFTNNTQRKLTITQKETCKTCAGTYTHLEKVQEDTQQFCSSGNFQILGKKELDLTKLESQLEEEGFQSSYDNVVLSVKGDSFSMLIFKDGRALIKAKDRAEAESLYSKYIGN